MYNDLNIHQKITLKEIFDNRKFRSYCLSHRIDQEGFKAIRAVALLWNWQKAIDYYFTEDRNILLKGDKLCLLDIHQETNG